jgi:excisionase family DNA binding protein
MLTISQAATMLGVAPSTLRHQVRHGRLRARRLGSVYVVSPREVERYRRQSLGRPGRPRLARQPL